MDSGFRRNDGDWGFLAFTAIAGRQKLSKNESTPTRRIAWNYRETLCCGRATKIIFSSLPVNESASYEPKTFSIAKFD